MCIDPEPDGPRPRFDRPGCRPRTCWSSRSPCLFYGILPAAHVGSRRAGQRTIVDVEVSSDLRTSAHSSLYSVSMPSPDTIDVLNRVLVILERSFPQYLRYARPYIPPGRENVMETIERDRRRPGCAGRAREPSTIFESGGLPDHGEFPDRIHRHARPGDRFSRRTRRSTTRSKTSPTWSECVDALRLVAGRPDRWPPKRSAWPRAISNRCEELATGRRRVDQGRRRRRSRQRRARRRAECSTSVSVAMQLFDTHAHLINRSSMTIARRSSREPRRRASRTSSRSASRPTRAQRACELAAEYDGVHAAVGMQPNYLAEAKPGDWDRVVADARRAGRRGDRRNGARSLLGLHAVRRAAGLFRPALRLSQERGLPFIVHMRDCDEDILVMLREARARGPLMA